MRASMKYTAGLTALICLSSAMIATAHDVSDKENVTTHDLSGFTAIEVAGVYDLDVTVGKDFFVQTSGSDKEVEFMDIRVEDGRLILATKKGKKSWNVGNKKGIHAIVTLPELTAMDIAGVATGDVRHVKAGDFDVEVAGIAELNLSGTCDRLDLAIAGMGEVEAEALKCKDVDVNIAGMGEASVYASHSVDARAAGMGQIDVYGKPDKVSKKR